MLSPPSFVSLWKTLVVLVLALLYCPFAMSSLTLGGVPLDIDDDIRNKIDPAILQLAMDDRPADFFIWMNEKANFASANRQRTKEEKGRFVFDALMETAQRSQASIRAELDSKGIDYRWYYIANKILVKRGTRPLILNIAQRSDVLKLTADYPIAVEPPSPSAAKSTRNIESNLSFIRADQAWSGLGVTGHGTVLAGVDTGMEWDHPAIINNYRGWNGSSADHNYNWWDATGQYPFEPGDGDGHGTHVSGTMAGDTKSGRVIGVSPDSQLIHCKFLNDEGRGFSSDASECFEFLLAPWDLSYSGPGTGNPRPELAPDAINNSWGGSGGGSYHADEIEALVAAGILVEVSAGNDGWFGCNTLGSPGDYQQVLSTGSVRHSGTGYPGVISNFSSRGPSSLYLSTFFPSIMAPGEEIVSSVPGGGYEALSGTSMAGPHVTGLVGLLWSANPGLRGNVAQTMQIIQSTATPLTDQAGHRCGGDYTEGPNHDWGHGTIDAYAAVMAALGSVPTAIVEFEVGSKVVSEGAGEIVIVVTRSGLLNSTVSVDYRTLDGTGVSGEDYISARGSITFAANETRKEILVAIIDNDEVDGNRDFQVKVDNAINGSIGSRNHVLVTISDNDLDGNLRSIGTGMYSSFAVTENGRVWAWGNNKYGQLGDGTTTNRLLPVPIGSVEGVVKITGGYSSTLALKEDGTVWAWGKGYAAGNPNYDIVSPRQISGISNVIDIASGQWFSVALKDDGTVWAWGSNTDGRLGNGTTEDTHIPTKVSRVDGIVAIAAASFHTIALSENGDVWVWGENDCSQLGDGTFNQRLTPYQIPNLKAKSVTAGHVNSAAMSIDNQIWIWGNWGTSSNGFVIATCDDDENSKPSTPQRIDFSGVTSIEAVSTTIYGVSPSGKVLKWGYGWTSEVTELSNIISVSGELHALFHHADGEMFAMGRNDDGQLGDGTTEYEYNTPVRVLMKYRGVASGRLEMPMSGESVTGIGVIRGWHCDAREISISIDGKQQVPVVYGNLRGDTEDVCGDTNNGFELLWNWGLLERGQHQLQVFVDGIEFENTTFEVVKFGYGDSYVRGLEGQFDLRDFPTTGEQTTIRWIEGLQNFSITGTGTYSSGLLQASENDNYESGRLEIPRNGDVVSGVGLIRGWHCTATSITASINGGAQKPVVYGNVRGDTRGVCGDVDNGFQLLWNWSLLGSGIHHIALYADGIEFANATFEVVKLDVQDSYIRGLSGQFELDDFPENGELTTVGWSEKLQNFTVIETTH